MGQYLGPGLLGLGVTAMIAGFMSGMAGNVSAFATVWTYDVYRPLFKKNAADSHYLKMGRWCSVLGVFYLYCHGLLPFLFLQYPGISAGLDILLHLPLFGLVLLGMLWKRATPTAGFLGFLVSIIASMSMWFYVHSFPQGFRPYPQMVLGKGAMVSMERDSSGMFGGSLWKVGNWRPRMCPSPEGVGQAEVTIAGLVLTGKELKNLRILAPSVVMAGTQEKDKFGVEGIPVGFETWGDGPVHAQVESKIQSGGIQYRTHQVYCPIGKSQTHGRESLQRILDLDAVHAGDRGGESVYQTQA